MAIKNGQNGTTNGNGSGKPATLVPLQVAPPQQAEQQAQTPTAKYDQAIILQQPARWSRAIVWGIVGVTTFSVLWAAIARIEEAVPAQGLLEPQESVQAVQAPLNGVVQEILVEDGQRVSQGDVLIRFDPRAAAAQQESLESIRESLQLENAFYRNVLTGVTDPSLEPTNVSSQILALTTNRAALGRENQLYRAQLGLEPGASLSAGEIARLQAGQLESDSRASAARLEVAQLQQQQTQVNDQLTTARQTLGIDQEILDRIVPLAEDGGIAQVQVMRQRQETLTKQGEVTRLEQERGRIDLAIAQAQQRLTNTMAMTSNDLLTRMAGNEEKIANIDSQLNKTIVENEKRISEINSQLSQTNLTLSYQELRAPIDGVVFDLQAKGIGFVANTSEPIVKIVPSNALVAEVYITNRDIGFLEEGMPVDVRVDSFPFSEFGDIKGTLVSIGSDALPPDQIYQFYRFPAKVELERQFIRVNNREIPLQSGMSISTNIIVRNRTVMSLFTDRFARGIDSLKGVR